MDRQQLEHIIRAAAGITGADEFIVIGGPAILGQFPDAPPELLVSLEADLFTFRSPEDSDLIDGSIGESSPFHRTFGYYAHGVGPETAVLPQGWRERLVAIKNPNTAGSAGLCLEVHDLAVSKLIAGREKELQFLDGLLRHGMVSQQTLASRLSTAPISDAFRRQCLEKIGRLVAGADPS